MFEWVVGYRDKNGEIRISGLSRVFDNEEDANESFEYAIGPYRKMMEAEAAKEDLNKTNWATFTLAEKKKERPVLLKREVQPYSIEREAPDWK